MIGYWSDLVRHYVGLGIRCFRCGAAYQVPAEVWNPLVEAARATCADCMFAAETLGSSSEQAEARCTGRDTCSPRHSRGA
jgi:starch synthase (maltosyl-transferring)